MLHLIYRTMDGDNEKGRPGWYSKTTCVQSLQAAVAGSGATLDLAVFEDGAPAAPSAQARALGGEWHALPGLGNSGAWRAVVHWALDQGWPDEDWIYFIEDDYVHERTAIAELSAATQLGGRVEYLSMYRHPNAARANDPHGPQFAGGWHPVVSTCMTFAARVGAVRRDRQVLLRAAHGSVPEDFSMWLALQAGRSGRAAQLLCNVLPDRLRAPVREALWTFNKRRALTAWAVGTSPMLLAPSTSLATHAELGCLADGRNWAHVVGGTPTGS